jgi:predicted acyl esterase
MDDVLHTFKKGHRIMVHIQSTWFPLVDRNPQQFVDIYNAKPTDFVKATERIYHSAAHASRIELPVLP